MNLYWNKNFYFACIFKVHKTASFSKFAFIHTLFKINLKKYIFLLREYLLEGTMALEIMGRQNSFQGSFWCSHLYGCELLVTSVDPSIVPYVPTVPNIFIGSINQSMATVPSCIIFLLPLFQWELKMCVFPLGIYLAY